LAGPPPVAGAAAAGFAGSAGLVAAAAGAVVAAAAGAVVGAAAGAVVGAAAGAVVGAGAVVAAAAAGCVASAGAGWGAVLGVAGDQPIREDADRREGIHVLPDHVRGVVVEPPARARDLGEHAPPDGRADREVLAARPLVAGEEHRTVLDPDAHAVLLGE